MSSEDRQFEPTPHHRQKMREEGRAAVSRDLVSAAMLLIAVGLFTVLGEYLCRAPAVGMARAYAQEPWLQMTPERFLEYWNGWVLLLLSNVFAVLAWIPLTVVGLTLLQTRGLFLLKNLFPNPKKLNPAAGFARIFSWNSTVSTLMGLCKVILVSAFILWVCMEQLPDVLAMYSQTFPQAVGTLRGVLLGTGWKIAGALFVLALFDYGWQRYRYQNDLKMTYQQLREELRVEKGGRP